MAKFRGSEKRGFKRLDRMIGVNIISCDNKNTEPKLDEEVGLNVSEGGILLECTKRIPKGTSVSLKIMLALDTGYRIVHTAARIAWNKKSFRHTYYHGCKFSRLKHDDKLLLIRYIKASLP